MDSIGGGRHHASMDLFQLLVVMGVVVLAGGVKGATGMGLPTVAMNLLGLWMMPAQAAAMLVVPSLATNVAQCRGPHLRQLAARLWPGWMAIAIVTIAAPGFGGSDSTELAKHRLGSILTAYGALGLWRPVLPKDEMVQALGLSFTVATLALAVRVQAALFLVFVTLGVTNLARAG